MDGWMDGGREEWMDGWTDGRTDGQKHERKNQLEHVIIKRSNLMNPKHYSQFTGEQVVM